MIKRDVELTIQGQEDNSLFGLAHSWTFCGLHDICDSGRN